MLLGRARWLPVIQDPRMILLIKWRRVLSPCIGIAPHVEPRYKVYKGLCGEGISGVVYYAPLYSPSRIERGLERAGEKMEIGGRWMQNAEPQPSDYRVALEVSNDLHPVEAGQENIKLEQHTQL
ncbi:hypothetical protein KQX54_021875 [Cotesia glomerata]|uniref:Uncharacterized protein n=1 Tax=Cotesia glomerata TaxID=32391 RepID=A0AAV7J7S6_COTGL|nr:hypothetical protein KQX54_021875 [Cotesia glomerata]